MTGLQRANLKSFKIFTLGVCLLFVATLLAPLNLASAATGLVITNGAGGEGTNAWTNPANARGAANNVYATASPGPNLRITGNWNAYGFDSNLPLHAVITKVEVIAQYKVSSNLFDVRLEVQGVSSGVLCPTTAAIDNTRPTADKDVVVDITACKSWARNDVLNANFSTRIAAFNNAAVATTDFSLDNVRARITYTTPDYNQAAYRWFDNTDGTAVGSVLANQDAAPTLYAPRDKVRLRLLLHVTTANLLANSESFKLQFAQKGSTCAASSYADVTTTSLIAHFNNPSVVTNSLLTTNVADPTHGTDVVVPQAYNESGSFNTLNNVLIGQDGLWDVALVGNGMISNTAYCLRVVTSNSATLTGGYAVYPELVSSAAGGLTVDIVDGSALPVASPQFAFASMTSPINCSESVALLGTSSQKIRLKNTTDSQSWSVSIAATNGSSSLWSSGILKYDYNDGYGFPAGCSPGPDGDMYGGQMTINGLSGTLTPRAASACTMTGISRGSSAAFAAGTLNAISLVTAGGTADTGCFWDLTGVEISQQIPGGQQPGDYTINLTLTILAS